MTYNNLRFVPTPTGSLHCGHAYMALVNEREAHRHGGKFVVRIDDDQPYWIQRLGLKLIDQYCAEYQEQLSQVLTIDKFERQSNMPSPHDIIGVDHKVLSLIPKARWLHEQTAEWPSDPDMAMYPYAPRFTFEKVVWDFHEDVRWLIRGEDLATECALYDFFVDVLGLPRVRHTLLPRLRAVDRKELVVSGVSKTLGCYKFGKQLERFGVEGTMEFLKQSCLIDPKGDFYVENIKWNPTIVGFEY